MVNMYHPRRFDLFSFAKRDGKRRRFFPTEVLTENDDFCLHMQVTSTGRKANLMLILVILSPIILHTSKMTNVVLKKINSPFLFSLQFKTHEECSLHKIVLGLSI